MNESQVSARRAGSGCGAAGAPKEWERQSTTRLRALTQAAFRRVLTGRKARLRLARYSKRTGLAGPQRAHVRAKKRLFEVPSR